MPMLDVRGLRYNVEATGAGPALLLLHGFTASARAWDRHVPALRRVCTAVAVDLPGHGCTGSPHDPGRYRMDSVVRDLTELLDRLDIHTAAVLGYSMGGRVALHIAAAFPERVSALVLESASPGLATGKERAARMEADSLLADFIESEGVERFVSQWESQPLFHSQLGLPAPVLESVRSQRLLNRPEGLAGSLRGMGTGAQPSLWDRLPELQVPALLVTGELDAKFRGIAAKMAGLMPRASIAVVEGAGHTVHLERPAEFDRVVTQFLRAVNITGNSK